MRLDPFALGTCFYPIDRALPILTRNDKRVIRFGGVPEGGRNTCEPM
jgi:hypothetical protein